MDKKLNNWIHYNVFNPDEECDMIPYYDSNLTLAMMVLTEIRQREDFCSFSITNTDETVDRMTVEVEMIDNDGIFTGVSICHSNNLASAICKAVYESISRKAWNK